MPPTYGGMLTIPSTPKIETLYNDIVTLYNGCPKNDETRNVAQTMMDCHQGGIKGIRDGKITVDETKVLVDSLMDVVQKLQTQPTLQKNKRLKYIHKFLDGVVKSIQAESGQLEDSGKCLTFMKQLMSVYAPELVDESLVDQKYNDIKLKMREVYNILMDIADDREKYIFYRNLIQNIRDALQLVVRGGVNKFDGQKSNAIAKLIVDALLETWEDLSENVWGEIE